MIGCVVIERQGLLKQVNKKGWDRSLLFLQTVLQHRFPFGWHVLHTISNQDYGYFLMAGKSGRDISVEDHQMDSALYIIYRIRTRVVILELKCPNFSASLGAFVCSGFSRPKWISVTKAAKLRKSVTEKRDPKSIFHFRSRSATESTGTEFRDRK